MKEKGKHISKNAMQCNGSSHPCLAFLKILQC